ncbi:NAD(P)H-dependent glycerol-3-phosphate dehydrogenase [Caenispirillum salinarum]|uniref:NAD(P)H-dependent glycerol-3-phosphate dehydrogenase n=1 Tax=Caenispirillum salinarum TaxID=859058 RepID=UPI00384CEDE9
MMEAMQRIGVIGAGAWGTALAQTLRRAGRDVILWAREPEVVDAINHRNENTDFLPGVALDPAIHATEEITDALAADAVLLVVPAQHMRSVCVSLAPRWPTGVPAVVCAKGIEQTSASLMHETVEDVLPADVPVAVLSGPTFAAEVVRGLPTAVTLAMDDAHVGRALVDAIGTPTFRPYYAPDRIGAEIGGAVKNVMAIAAGIVDGRKLGDNARAALLTRGLAEITRLAVAKGGRAETLMGLSGLGDLVLTASSLQSRNYSLGHALGEGKTLEEVMGGRKAVTEGVYTASAVVALANDLSVDMPICAAVDGVLNHQADLDQTIRDLLNRPFKAEHLI